MFYCVNSQCVCFLSPVPVQRGAVERGRGLLLRGPKVGSLVAGGLVRRVGAEARQGAGV